jgi:hypothetical protein
MKEYIDNGVRLGILINRKFRQVEIYRPGKEVEVLESPATVSGEDVLKGFVLNLGMIWYMYWGSKYILIRLSVSIAMTYCNALTLKY